MVGARSFLAASRLMKNQTRGKALANWARPSIDEMGVPTESWKQVRSERRGDDFLNSILFLPFLQVHDKNQAKYMIHLGAGVLAFGAAVFAFSQQVFMNGAPKHLLKNN